MYGKNFDLKKEGTTEKISYERRRAYQSVDDRILSNMSQKSTENETQALMS